MLIRRHIVTWLSNLSIHFGVLWIKKESRIALRFRILGQGELTRAKKSQGFYRAKAAETTDKNQSELFKLINFSALRVCGKTDGIKEPGDILHEKIGLI